MLTGPTGFRRGNWPGTVLLAAVLLARQPLCSPARATPPRPNIVVIMTDDQRWDTLGNTHSVSAAPVMPLTRSLLGNSGVTFTNAFSPTPVCAPTRSSLLSGQYAHDHRVIANFPPLGGAPVFDDSVTLATLLQSAGYRTGLYGKYINYYNKLWQSPSPAYVPPGWTEWHAFKVDNYYNYILVENGVEVPYGSAPADYSTDVLRSKAVSFIQGAVGAGEPFFLFFTPFGPHDPATPAPRHLGSSAGLTAWRPPSWNEPDVSDKSAWLRATAQLTPTQIQTVDAFRIGQVDSLKAVDEAVNSIVGTLTALNVLQNTIVVFTSDNGFFWGEHRLDWKEDPYEEALRVPLIVRYPPLAPVARSENRLVNVLDLPRTFLSLAGATIPSWFEGASLEPVLDDSATSWRTDILAEAWRVTDVSTNPWAMVREAQWKYIEYATGEKELYDLVADPLELTNIAGLKSSATRLAAMAARLRVMRPNWPSDAGCVDQDGDGYNGPGNASYCATLGPDCNDASAAAWSVPGEVTGAGFDPDRITLRWQPLPAPGGVASSVVFDTLRSPSPWDFIGPAVCIESDDGADRQAVDPATPAAGGVFYYLLRAENGCPGASGTLGTWSNGFARSGVSCLASAPPP